MEWNGYIPVEWVGSILVFGRCKKMEWVDSVSAFGWRVGMGKILVQLTMVRLPSIYTSHMHMM